MLCLFVHPGEFSRREIKVAENIAFEGFGLLLLQLAGIGKHLLCWGIVVVLVADVGI
jgi:hypothetical protein